MITPSIPESFTFSKSDIVPDGFLALMSLVQDTIHGKKMQVILDDDPRPIAAKAVEIIDSHRLRMTLVQGKYHQVKRMIAACSNRCDALHRSSFGLYKLPETLRPGEWVWICRSDIV